ncbi:hypothetical protein JCM8097_003623 [Rhodosporidiobolus ruineniae]
MCSTCYDGSPRLDPYNSRDTLPFLPPLPPPLRIGRTKPTAVFLRSALVGKADKRIHLAPEDQWSARALQRLGLVEGREALFDLFLRRNREFREVVRVQSLTPANTRVELKEVAKGLVLEFERKKEVGKVRPPQDNLTRRLYALELDSRDLRCPYEDDLVTTGWSLESVTVALREQVERRREHRREVEALREEMALVGYRESVMVGLRTRVQVLLYEADDARSSEV